MPSEQKIKDVDVYARIGMALICAQRVEFITENLLLLIEVEDEIMFDITGEEFFNSSKKSAKARKMLGNIFQSLKLTPGITIEDRLNDYLKKRNLLVHRFWKEYLNKRTQANAKKAIGFCNDFMKQSSQLESYFKGFMFFLELRHTMDSSLLSSTTKEWQKDFEYFVSHLEDHEIRYGNFMVKLEKR